MRTPKLLIVGFIGFAIMFASSVCHSKDPVTYGVGIFYGHQFIENGLCYTSDRYDWQYANFITRYGRRFSDRFEGWLEGEMGLYVFNDGIGDTLSFGTSAMLSYDFIKFSAFRIYGEGGVGLAYWLETPSENLVSPGLLGNVQYGFGVRFDAWEKSQFVVGYRFTHHSRLFVDDCGANSHGLMFSLIW